MNREAERHLDKAESYLGKGDGWYRKAAAEIVAAQEADPSLSNREIGERFDRSATWVREMATFATTSLPEAKSPKWTRGSHATTAEIQAGAQKLLAEAPMEQVERIVEALPKKRQQAIAAAAGHGYSKLREEYDRREREMTPAQRKEREAAVGEVASHAGRVLAPFSTLSIANHLDSATDLLKEMIENDSLTSEMLKTIDTALAAFLDEYKVAQARAGMEAGA
jgi:hypothetical protein